MPAGTFTVFKRAKGNLGKGALNFSGNYYMGLFETAVSANIIGNLSTYGSLGSEIAATGGYAAGGKALAAVTWTTGASAGQWRLDSTARIFTANGGNLTNIRYAVVRQSAATVGASKIVAYAALTGVQFTLNSGSTLTVTPAANGYFTLA